MSKTNKITLLLLSIVALGTMQPLPSQASCGEASWYGPGLYGNTTSNGEILRPGTMTAAHRTLPFGTIVNVVNRSNGKSARVRINDRGPFVGNRLIDLSEAVASRLGMTGRGVSEVCIYTL